MADPDTESLTPEHGEKLRCCQCGTTRASSYCHSGFDTSCDRCAFLSLVGSCGAMLRSMCPPRPPPETGEMVALEATIDAFLPVQSASQRDAMTDSFAAKRAAAGDGEYCHVMELALTNVLIGPCHKFVWVISPNLPALNVPRLGLVIDAAALASHMAYTSSTHVRFFAFRKVGGGEVPVRLVPAQLSSGAWLPTNLGHDGFVPERGPLSAGDAAGVHGRGYQGTRSGDGFRDTRKIIGIGGEQR